MREKRLPLYALPYTQAFLATNTRETAWQFQEVAFDRPIHHGPFTVQFVGMTHSFAQAALLVIDTPDGRVVHSGDFKVDPCQGDGTPFPSARLEQLGREGVDVLLMDSTNSTRRGFSGSEADLEPAFEELFHQTKGRLFVTTFSSSMPRLLSLMKMARKHQRQAGFIGRSFQRHLQAVQQSEYPLPLDEILALEQLSYLKDHQVLYFITGSQGEAKAALAKLARGPFRGIQLKPSDTVLFSARPIPGNERTIGLLQSSLLEQHIQVIPSVSKVNHVSGHAYREEQRYLVQLLKPGTVIPIHGEHSMLESAGAALSPEDKQTRWVRARNGDELILGRFGVHVHHHFDGALLPIDGNQECPVPPQVLKERKDMMYSGLILISKTKRHGRLQFNMDTLGIAEAHPGRLVEQLQAFLKKTERENPQLLEQPQSLLTLIKSQLKHLHAGKPRVKLVNEGEIIT
jgi:ribonuclease J